MLDLTNKLSLIFESDDDYTAAVAVVRYRQKWLLGLSTSKDDRHRKWCFPGGGIKRGECPLKAAERECWEETGLRPKAAGNIMTVPSRPGIAFVPCRFTGTVRFKPNSEFSALGFFDAHEFDSLTLFRNVRDLQRRAARYL